MSNRIQIQRIIAGSIPAMIAEVGRQLPVSMRDDTGRPSTAARSGRGRTRILQAGLSSLDDDAVAALAAAWKSDAVAVASATATAMNEAAACAAASGAVCAGGEPVCLLRPEEAAAAWAAEVSAESLPALHRLLAAESAKRQAGEDKPQKTRKGRKAEAKAEGAKAEPAPIA